MACSLVTVVILALFSALNKDAVEATFNCMRDGSGCMHGGACQYNGTCTCKAPFSGYRCQDDLEPDATGQCSQQLQCAEGATCLTSGGQPRRCQCDADHYGTTCQLKRYDVRCSRQHMTFNINPVGFSGRVVTLTDINGPATVVCVLRQWLTPDPERPDGWEGYGKVHRYTGNDPSDCIGNLYKVQDGDYDVFKLMLVVQYEPTDPPAVYATDEIVDFECRVNRKITGDVTTAVQVDAVTNGVFRDTVKAKGEVKNHVYYSVEYADGAEIPRSMGVPIGTALRISFSLAPDSQYKTIGVSSCRALGDPSDTAEKWVDLVDDKCYFPPAAQGYAVSESQDTAYVYFKAVLILPSKVLYMRCYVYACTPQAQEGCRRKNTDKTKCSRPSASLRRKREKPVAVGGGGDLNYTVVITHILLEDPRHADGNAVAEDPRLISEDSHVPRTTLWVVVSAACVSSVVFLVTLTMCVRSLSSASRAKTCA